MRAVLRDCCSQTGGELMSLEAARRVALALAQPLGRAEDVPLSAAIGRVLAAAIEAPQSLPPFDQAAMDGYAVRVSGRTALPLVLPVAGYSSAGDPPGVLTEGTAHRIMTGAALPGGADTVVMQEHATRKGDLVQFSADIEPGAHVRHAGEDVRAGTVVLDAGRSIGWPEVALLAGLGIGTVPVASALRIGVLTTGSELRNAGAPLPPGAIYDGNGPMLAALLGGPDVQVVSLTVGDDMEAIEQGLDSLAKSSDLLITTAGMSVGESDRVREALVRAGAQFETISVAMKPGKPLALGRLRGGCFVGLPGNPQAAACGALAFVRPMVAALLGKAPACPVTAAIAFPCRPRRGRTELLPVRLDIEQGHLTAHRSGPDGSHRLVPMVAADAIAIVPGTSPLVGIGTVVEVLPFDGARFGR